MKQILFRSKMRILKSNLNNVIRDNIEMKLFEHTSLARMFVVPIIRPTLR